MKLLLLFFILFNSSLLASSNPIQELEKRVTELTLKNGMKVLILERPQFPLVSFEMMYKVGGADELPGKTGLAHLFEHMMFKGSKTVGALDFEKEKPILEQIEKVALEISKEESKENGVNPKKLEELYKKLKDLENEHAQWINPEEFDEIYSRAGAEGLNAFTGKDMTGFVVSLPSNKWELWFALESDRMQNPVLREFYKERDVVMEERRMRYENEPRGILWENLIATSFRAHPYAYPTIGWSSDIQKLSVLDAKNFYQLNYVPNRAAVAIVGNVSSAKMIEAFKKHFEAIPGQDTTPQPKTEEPLQSGERRVNVPFEAEPQILMGFHKPGPPHPDNFAMEMIEQILSRGRTSRFYRNIVEKKLALSAYAANGNPGERYSNLIAFGGSPRKPNKNEDLERAVWVELETLKTELVSESDLAKIRNQIEADFIRSLQSNSGMASQLSYYQTVWGDWRYLFRYLDGLRSVTAAQIQEAAKNYFVKNNVTIVSLRNE